MSTHHLELRLGVALGILCVALTLLLRLGSLQWYQCQRLKSRPCWSMWLLLTLPMFADWWGDSFLEKRVLVGCKSGEYSAGREKNAGRSDVGEVQVA